MNDDNGHRAAETLETYLAARLRGEYLPPPKDTILAAMLLDLAETMEPDPDFAAALGTRLYGAAAHPSALLTHWQRFTLILRRQMMHKRTVFTLAGVAALILLGLFGPTLFAGLFQGPVPVSAAEILHRANATLTLPLEKSAVLYDRLTIDWQAATTQRDVVAELWQAPGGDRFRYQLTDAEGNLLYFVQRDGERVWRSVHAQPVGAETVTAIYELPLETYRAQIPAGSPSLPLFFSELSTAWPVLERLVTARSEACADLNCMFGVPQGEWTCHGEECTLPVDDGTVYVEALVSRKTLADGRAVYEVRLNFPGDWTRVLLVDAESFALVEITDSVKGRMVTRLRHLERRALSEPLESDQIFGPFPEGLEVVASDQTEAGVDRVWIVSATPEAGTMLRGRTEFEVVVGYELASVPQASLQIVLARPGCFEASCKELYEDNRLPIVGGTDLVTLTAGEGEFTARFSVDPAHETWLKPGDMALGVRLATWEGATRMNPLLIKEFADYYWVFP
jgi:hypothetical protein